MMALINTKNINEARKQIQKSRGQNPKEEIIVKAQDGDFNRKILEIPDVNILLSPELHQRKKPLKQRDSGLNEILCRIAKNNNIKIGIDIDEIKRLNKKEKAIAIARVMQNIRLCKKTKTEIIVFQKDSYKKQDIMSLLLSLKSSTEQAKRASE